VHKTVLRTVISERS